MRSAGAIFSLLVALAAGGQTGPPLLRCLDVQQNGNVILHWTPPSTPTVQFSHYEIWFGISKQGTYALASQTVAPVTTQSVVHTVTTGVTQTLFYFMRSVMTDGSFSQNSDTLQTIFLDIFNGDPALNLVYNRPGAGYAPSFTITKEFPLGTVNTLTTTTKTNHFDVISVCKADIRYQVELAHGSGCISRSNPVLRTFLDTKYPDTTYIDSISVLPDGRTVMSWPMAADPDVDSLYVIRGFPPNSPNVVIDRFKGAATVSYTYSSYDANNMPVWLTVMAIDSCGKRGNFDKRPVTMHLIASYDRCSYTSELIWNSYRALKNGIKEYRIYYSTDSGATFVPIRSTTDTFFIHKNVDPRKQICYYVRVFNNGESVTASSNRRYFYSREVGVPSFFYMSSASVNRSNGVDLRIFTSQDETFSSLLIQRARDTATFFTTIATLPNNGTVLHTFTDPDARTSEYSYRYRAMILDSCGNNRGGSNICRTILLKITDGENEIFERRLQWSQYEGFTGGIRQYNIYRVVNGQVDAAAIGSVPPDQDSFTDNLEPIAAEGASIAYFVQAEEVQVQGSSITETSNSNLREVHVEGRIFVPNAFAPAGRNKKWMPVSHFVQKTEYLVRVFNRWGEEVFHTTADDEAWDGGNCEPGMYVYLIRYVNSRGEYREQKGSVLLLR